LQDKIDDQTDAISKGIQAKRFDAEDVEVPLADKEPLLGLVSKVIASIKTNALLQVGGELINPNKWTAHHRFNHAKWALNRWDFEQCNRNLEDAMFLTREPELQQQVTLLRWILDIIASLYKIRIETKRDFTALSNAITERLEKFDQLDKLPSEEKEFYAKELRKLQEGVTALKGDDSRTVTLFYLWHARKDLELSSNEVSLVWLLKAYQLQKSVFLDKLDPKDTLFTTLEQVKAGLRAVIDPIENAELPEPVNPYDFLGIFKDRWGEILTRDIDKEIFYAFNVLHYNEPLKEEGGKESKPPKKPKKGKEKGSK